MSETPPHDLHAEEALLGAVLLSDVALKKLIIDVGLNGPAFYRKQHEQIWEAMCSLALRGERVDIVTLRVELEGAGIGLPPARLDELTGCVPAVGNTIAYARRIMETAEWRRVLEASYELQESARSADSELRHRAESKLQHVRRSSSDTLTGEGWAEAIARHLEGEEIPAWKTPWPTFNKRMGGGLRAGEVTLLGGWTSAGKSVITDQLLRWCHDHGAKVHLYINEMAPVMRGLRVLSSMSSVEQYKLAQPKTHLNNEDLQRAVRALGRGMPFGVTNVTDWTAADVARDIRFQSWDVCALDLIHRLPFHDERDMAEISTMLNAAAQASQTHLVGVVHLNEARATGTTLPTPVLRDIRYSGMLKNDADNVMFIHRDEETVDGVQVRTESGQLYLQKCRNGELGGVKLNFDSRRLRFLELAG